MHATGATEAIAHFAGLLRMLEETHRARVEYDKGAELRSTDAPKAHATPLHERPGELDDFDPRAVKLARVEDADDVRLDPAPTDASPDPSRINVAGHQPPPLDNPGTIAHSSGGSGGEGPEIVTPTPNPTPDETIIDDRQINLTVDGDVFGGDGSDMRAPGADALKPLISDADHDTPNEFTPDSVTSEGYVALITSRDAVIANGGGGDADEVAPGRYVNGELSAEAIPEIPEWRGPSTPEDEGSKDQTGHLDGLGKVGLEVETGSNMAGNSLVMRDFGSPNAAMIVYGDHFRSDIIVQTNVLQNHDTLELDGAKGAGALETGGDQTFNVASFISTSYETHWNGATGAETWRVDKINGDFYDVSVVSQLNTLIDGDWSSQTSFNGYGMVSMGGNQLANVGSFNDIASHYDLIIVTGSVHEANWIFQSNILIDDDWITLSADGLEGNWGVSSGDNLLINEATIARYGQAGSQALTDDVRDFADRLGKLGDGKHVLSGPIGAPGDGGPIDVLFIDGDLFNLNIINQRNVISDSDDVRQALSGADGAKAHGSISTGGNVLVNSATIAAIGSSSDQQYIGGKVYDQAILVQANLVSDHPSVTFGDTKTLVSEVIAFTGVDATASAADDISFAAPTTGASSHDPGHMLT